MAKFKLDVDSLDADLKVIDEKIGDKLQLIEGSVDDAVTSAEIIALQKLLDQRTFVLVSLLKAKYLKPNSSIGEATSSADDGNVPSDGMDAVTEES